MATVQEKSTLTPLVASRLAWLRTLIRGYIILQGSAAALIALAMGFWVSLLIDWTVELSPAGRAAVLALIGLVVVFVVYRFVISRLLVKLSDRNMAMLLERRYRSLDDRLLTVVELAERSPEQQGYSPRMLDNTRKEADRLVPSTAAGSVFNILPLVIYAVIAILMVGAIGGFLLWQRQTARIWIDRSLLLGDAKWPRATQIGVDGFPPDSAGRRLVKVAKGSSLTVSAHADMEWAIPGTVEIHYEAEEGFPRRPNMTKLKDAVRGRDTHQLYEYEFTNIQTTTTFDVVAKGGGIFSKHDRVQNLVIEAVESPDLSEIQLQCVYPDYLKRSAETFSVRLARPMPEGTHVRIVARANKDLRRAAFRHTLDHPDAASQEVELDSADPRSVSVDLGALRADTRIAFQLVDTDGVKNQQPIRLLLRVTPDEPPAVEVDLVGIGKAVTPFADLPIRGIVSDDHKVSQTWFEIAVDGGTAQKFAFPLPDNGRLDDEADVVFQMAELGLQPGQKIAITVKAADNFALEPVPHIGAGPRYDLRIVSEGELRGLLETRERILRRRFEGIIAEMKRMQDSLKRMDSHEEDRVPSANRGAPLGEGLDTDPAEDGIADALSSEQGNSDEADSRSERLASVRVLRTETALQTSDRMRHETLSVALEFDRILVELENNNVTFIEELQRRLGDGISAPLKKIANKQFPQLDDRLRQLRRVLEDDQLRPTAIARSRQQLDSILSDLDQILKNMLELQKFNELLADLRKIIDAQKQVSNLTEKERKEIERRRKEELKKGLLD